jgi:hypothetical protein
VTDLFGGHEPGRIAGCVATGEGNETKCLLAPRRFAMTMLFKTVKASARRVFGARRDECVRRRLRDERFFDERLLHANACCNGGV